jgi:hypothetical protein
MIVQEDPSILLNEKISVENINRTYKLFQSEVNDLTDINTPLPWKTGWCYDHARKKTRNYSFQDAGKLLLSKCINNRT